MAPRSMPAPPPIQSAIDVCRRAWGNPTMKPWQCALAAVATAGLVAAAYLGKVAEEPGDKMTVAAEQFIGSLNAEQKKKTVLDFDDKERTNWHFVPLETRDKKPRRKGLSLEDMT